ncbi:MAG TPA: hypothetical protein VLL72_07175 [Kiloniellales bacterium]|nr:hypothetical protein [Kiloniellales bacterium]
MHRRMATPPVRAIGTASRQSVVGFTAACGSLSMWISNTASVAALLPNAA